MTKLSATCAIVAASILAACATHHGPAFRAAKEQADLLAMSQRHVQAGQRMTEFAESMEPGSFYRVTALLDAADYLAAGEARGAAMSALNECIAMRPQDGRVRSMQHLCSLKRDEFSRGQFTTQRQLQQRITSATREREADEAEEAAARPALPAAALPPMVIGTPPVNVPGPGTQMPSAQANRSMARNYCVHPAYAWHESGSGRQLHVTFKNNCPIPVRVGWCPQRADGSCAGGGGSPEIAAGGQYSTRFLGRDVVRARYIACSATASGYNTNPSLAEWYCGRER